MPLGKDIDELLSGYLDGQLTGDELQLIEASLKEDRQLAVRLLELRELSSNLRELAKLPVKGLPSDFAAQVVARCSDHACVSSESPSDSATKAVRRDSEHSGAGNTGAGNRSSGQRGSGQRGSDRRGSQRTGYRSVASALAALAGMVLLAVWLPRFWNEETEIQPLASSSGLADSSRPDSLDPVASGGNSSSSGVLEGTLGAEGSGKTETGLDGLAQGEVPVHDSGQLAAQRPAGSQIQYTLVLDLEITELAVQQEVLKSLFSKYGIDLAIGVPLNSEIQKAVNRMRYSVLESQESKSAQLFLVRAPAAILDAAVGELESEVELVPGYRFDLAFQTPTVSLTQAIADAMGGQAMGSAPIAVPVVQEVGGSSLSAKIESVPYQGTLISSSRRRERFDSDIPEAPVGGEMSYLLILVRQQ